MKKGLLRGVGSGFELLHLKLNYFITYVTNFSPRLSSLCCTFSKYSSKSFLIQKSFGIVFICNMVMLLNLEMPKNGTSFGPMKLLNIQVKVTTALSKESHPQVPPAHGTGVRKKINDFKYVWQDSNH